MASAASKINLLSLIVPVFAPLAVGTMGWAAYTINWRHMIQQFFTGPGRTSRIALLLFVVFNWKTMPFAWTYRVFNGIFYHSFFRKPAPLRPDALFKPIITTSAAPLLEIDYNLHKSNSTYFADMDVSRSHLVCYLMRPAFAKLAKNSTLKLVRDPKTDQAIRGHLGVMLGSVACSFKREIPPYKPYEMWSRVLSWDRKWVFIVTHYVPKGMAKPTHWLDPGFAKVKTRKAGDASDGWEKKIYATAVSKYVFKVGRFTVHPAIVLGESGLLPERPGGWMAGENQLGDEAADVSDVVLSEPGEWDWRRVEAQRRHGMVLAGQFHALDALQDVFDGGNNGALASFGPG